MHKNEEEDKYEVRLRLTFWWNKECNKRKAKRTTGSYGAINREEHMREIIFRKLCKDNVKE